MVRGQPVVKYQTLPPHIRAVAIGAFVIFLIFVGFVLGVFVSNIDPEPTAISLPLEINDVQHTPRQVAAQTPTQKYTSATHKWDAQDLNEEIECLAQNIYFEAKNQSRKGQVAVGLVTINRVLSNHYPNTICDVVWQKQRSARTGKWVAQFSWTWDGKADQPINQEKWEEIYRIAQAMLAGHSLFNFADFTQGATHYHANYVQPYWRHYMTYVIQIEDHIFYRDENVTPRRSVVKTLVTDV